MRSSRASEFPQLLSLTSENPEDQDPTQHSTKKSAKPHEEGPPLAAHLICFPPQISPPKLVSTPSYKKGSIQAQSTKHLTSTSFPDSALPCDTGHRRSRWWACLSLIWRENATKDIIEGGGLNVTKPSILTKDLTRPKVLHELEVVNARPRVSSSHQASFPGKSSANVTHNVDMNRTQNVGSPWCRSRRWFRDQSWTKYHQQPRPAPGVSKSRYFSISILIKNSQF